MPKIHKLKTLHCLQGTSDKIYIVAIVENNGFYSLKTAYCGRGEVANIRTPVTPQTNLFGIVSQFDTIVRDKSRKYDNVDNWRDDYYKPMSEVIYEWGTPPDEKVSGAQPISIQPVNVPAKVKKPAVKESVDDYDWARSGERDF